MIVVWILAAWVGLDALLVAAWCGMKWVAGLGREPQVTPPSARQSRGVAAPSRPDDFEYGHRVRSVR